MTLFDNAGYIGKTPADMTYSEIKEAIAAERYRLNQFIVAKEKELSELKMRLSAVEYEDRTAWLRFKE